VPLFDGVSQDELAGLAADSTLRQCVPGKVVIYAGMTVDGLYVVATGGVEVYVKIPGKGPTRVADLGPGEMFGETSIVEKTMSGATIKAGPDGAAVLVIPEAAFCGLVAGNEAFGARVRALIAARRAAPPAAKA
jgi:CRP-like cAMP-binding protein